MSRRSILFIASSMVALAMLAGFTSAEGKNDQTAQPQKAKADSPTVKALAPKFTLEIRNDSFGTFQPFNNQFRGSAPPAPPPRHGFLVQVGDFKDALHAYTRIVLHFTNGGTKEYLRGDGPPPWIDVICGQTSPDPITEVEAKELVPDENDSTTAKRRLHYDLNYQSPITAITLWGSEEGLQVRTETFHGNNTEPDATKGTHGHAKYYLTS